MEDYAEMEEFIIKMAPLVKKVLFESDAESERELTKLEEDAAKRFPKDHKRMQSAALNLALGHKG